MIFNSVYLTKNFNLHKYNKGIKISLYKDIKRKKLDNGVHNYTLFCIKFQPIIFFWVTVFIINITYTNKISNIIRNTNIKTLDKYFFIEYTVL